MTSNDKNETLPKKLTRFLAEYKIENNQCNHHIHCANCWNEINPQKIRKGKRISYHQVDGKYYCLCYKCTCQRCKSFISPEDNELVCYMCFRRTYESCLTVKNGIQCCMKCFEKHTRMDERFLILKRESDLRIHKRQLERKLELWRDADIKAEISESIFRKLEEMNKIDADFISENQVYNQTYRRLANEALLEVENEKAIIAKLEAQEDESVH